MSRNDDRAPAPAQILLDLTRIVAATLRPTPTGIRRVELAYANYLLARASADVQFVVRDKIGRLCLVARSRGEAFVREVGAQWRDGGTSRLARWRRRWRFHRFHAGLLLRGSRSLRDHVAAARGPTVYIVVSHLHLDRPHLVERLKSWGDVRLVFFVHDVIPSLFPEYFLRRDAAPNRALMHRAARLADAIVVNSVATRRAFLDLCGRDGIRGPTYVAPLGAAPLARPAPLATPVRPYFLCLGTIEPRKNHLLLLNLWRRFGPDAPRLIVVGARGWKNENVIDLLERSEALRGKVEERNLVTDDELARLLAGARALLLPSFIEGFGLPLAEALVAGVPALCSDIPAFREVGGDVPEYLDPLDGPAWQRAILAYAAEPSPRRTAQLERLKDWRAPTWEAHFAVLETILGDLAAADDAAPAPLGARAGL
jgi:glycosyltransferase involved in cell wall biosynthesis